MKTIAELETDIKNLNAEAAPLLASIGQKEKELGKAKSKEFIRVNNITSDDVQSSNEGGWHGTIIAFGKWMLVNKITKRFCEWNGCLFHTLDVINGKMIHTDGRADDVPASTGKETA